jgi:hypothetical protein
MRVESEGILMAQTTPKCMVGGWLSADVGASTHGHLHVVDSRQRSSVTRLEPAFALSYQETMKRATSGGSPSPHVGPEKKKPRLNSPNSNAFAILSSPGMDQKNEGDGEWTKVTKRKQKKARNVETKQSVSVLGLVVIP